MLFAFLLAILTVSKITFCSTEETVIPEVQLSLPANTTMPPLLDATASKLIRIRSKPPPNFFRHKSPSHKRSRPPRIVKSPKFKNNRPAYSTHFEQTLQPSSYYKFKPEIHTSTLALKPSYGYDEVHYEISPEYTKGDSNYDTQVMELDFYGDNYPKKKTTSYYEYSKPHKTNVKPQKFAPQYEYSKPQKQHKIKQSYGVPQEPSYNSFDMDEPVKPEVHYEISYHEEGPEPEPQYEPAPPQQKQKFEDYAPYGDPPKKVHQIEQVSYQIPSSNKYEGPKYLPQEPSPSQEGPYQVYDKKLPNHGYSYNNDFAEPPTDIHIIHSPSYDIETLPKAPQNNYIKPHETYGPPPNDNYGAPPPQNVYGAPSDTYNQPNSGHFAEPPESYLPPPHLPDDLPLNKNHMPPGYDYPKSSYEVPLYDPIPFESTTAEQDFFPPNHYDGAAQHEQVSESNTQHSTQTAASTTTTVTKNEQSQQANTKVHRFTPNKRRYKKPTTAKVPVSSEEPNLPDAAPSSEFIDEILSTTSTLRPRRKRKRTKSPQVKHNLDAPELKEAFETARDQVQSDRDELAAHSSNIQENIQAQEPRSRIKQITEFSPSHSWNPMRIRTKQPHSSRDQRTAQASLNDLKNVEVISIQKSHSHSYYAGTEAPNSAVSQRTRKLTSRADAVQMPTYSTTTSKAAENALKPTRGLVIDTTYFKVKENSSDENEDEDFYDGTGELPKNHKLF